jgi:hypothetical protein
VTLFPASTAHPSKRIGPETSEFSQPGIRFPAFCAYIVGSWNDSKELAATARGAAEQSLMAKVEMLNRIAMRSLVAVRIEE